MSNKRLNFDDMAHVKKISRTTRQFKYSRYRSARHVTMLIPSTNFPLSLLLMAWLSFPAMAQTIPSDGKQQPDISPVPNAEIPTNSWETRFQRLEARLDALERVVFATAKISVVEAERRLQDAEAQLRESRQLFLKGIIAEGRWRQDEFMVELLRRERDFLLDTTRQRKGLMEMELLQAENNLRIAEDQLNFLQNLANRGFATIDQIRETERYVADSKARLTLARERLQAAEELEAISGKPPTTQTPKK